jgi:hypothetical protein
MSTKEPVIDVAATWKSPKLRGPLSKKKGSKNRCGNHGGGTVPPRGCRNGFWPYYGTGSGAIFWSSVEPVFVKGGAGFRPDVGPTTRSCEAHW